MAKKLKICAGKSCKNAKTHKLIKKWAKGLIDKEKIKKAKCLGLCKDAYVLKYDGKIYTCTSKEALEEIIEKN